MKRIAQYPVAGGKNENQRKM